MPYQLRYKEHDLELPVGRYVIGRSATCQLSLDDPMVSRQHAVLVVRPDGVAVEDLGSRNGVLVNRMRVSGTAELSAGDAVRIGSQEMVLLQTVRQPRAEAVTRAALRTDRMPALGVLGGLTEKALALGHAGEAERLADPLLREVLERAEAGTPPSEETFGQVTNLAMRLANASRKGVWIDYLVRIHRALGRPFAATIIDELHELLRRVDAFDLGGLRSYAAELRERAPGMGPAERFLVNRIEGLERMASVR